MDIHKEKKLLQSVQSDLEDSIIDNLIFYSGQYSLDEEKEHKKEFDENEYSLKLMIVILGSHLWTQTKEEEYMDVVYHKLPFKVELLGESMGTEFLTFLLGKQCADSLITMDSGRLWKYSEDDLNYDYFISLILHAVFLVSKRISEMLKERLSDYLSYLETDESIFAGSDEYRAHIIFTLLDRYLIYEDIAATARIFQRNLELLDRFPSKQYALFCNQLAPFYETRDIDLAARVADKAYGLLQTYHQNISKKDEFVIRYNRTILNIKRNLSSPKYEYSRELYSLFDELTAFFAQDNEDVEYEILIARTAYYILLLVVDKKETGEKHLRYAQSFYDISVKHDDEFKDSPIFNRKVAAHYISLVYAAMGQFFVAEKYMKEAAGLAYEYPNHYVDYLVSVNLCYIYMMQNNIRDLKKEAKTVYQRLMEHVYPEDLSTDEKFRCIYFYSTAFVFEGKCLMAAKVIQRALLQGVISNDKMPSSLAGGICEMVTWLVSGSEDLEEDEDRLWGYLGDIEVSGLLENCNTGLQLSYIIAKNVLCWKCDKTGIAVDEAQECLFKYLQEMDFWVLDNILGYANIIACLDVEAGKETSAIPMFRRIVQMKERQLGQALVYQNRNRLTAYLQKSQKVLFSAYPFFMLQDDLSEAYNLVLNFKNILSLITAYQQDDGQESEEVRRLKAEIGSLQDKKSVIQVDRMFQEGDREQEKELDRLLSEKEYLYARLVGNKTIYRPFTLEEMLDGMPDNCLFLEYFFHYPGFVYTSLDSWFLDEGNLLSTGVISVFCFKVENNEVDIDLAEIEFAEIYEELFFYISQMGKRAHRKLDKSRKRLYDFLLKPFEEWLDWTDTVYIAPDSFLNELPFDVLTDEKGRMLQDKCRIILLDTGRDFVRKSKGDFASHFIAVGDPAYDIYAEQEGWKPGRAGILDSEIMSLPFTELETRAVAAEYGGDVYLGLDASKEVFDRLGGARWIHLAVHGMYDEESEADGWFSSALLLAGAENWRQTGKTDSRYDNGIMTADEIARMDLSHTELVVMSCCFAGRISGGDMAGIRTAFRAAGVKYIVSPLWEVDDMAGAVFMLLFYRLLKHEAIPDALRTAKRVIQRLTVSQVRQLLLENSVIYGLDSDQGIRQGLDMLMKMEQRFSKDYLPYQDPFYWSCFVCMQNEF